jgi:glycosyltransferase involved in cell wall biosynthesis
VEDEIVHPRRKPSPEAPDRTTESVPLLTIGLPVYNGADYLEKAMASVLAQTFTDFQLIICDNASTDNTPELCREYARADKRIVFVENGRNIGAAANYNKVVQLATGKYFAWINHDDLYHPDHLRTCVNALEQDKDAVLAYTHARHIDEHDDPLPYRFQENLGLDAARSYVRMFNYHKAFRALDREGTWPRLEGLYIPIYGIIRSDVLKATPLIGSFVDSDAVLIEQLLMMGRFIEIDKDYFLKRMHPKRSILQSQSYFERQAWFASGKPRRFVFPKWRILFERLKTCLVFPRSIFDKIGCFLECLLYYIHRPHQHRALVKEILINAAHAATLDRFPSIRRRIPVIW